LEDGGVVVAAGDVRAHLVLEVAVFGDALKVALLLLVGAHARGAGYAVLRSALLDAPLLSVNFPARSCGCVQRQGFLTSAIILWVMLSSLSDEVAVGC
jgi:hypothetical protein